MITPLLAQASQGLQNTTNVVALVISVPFVALIGRLVWIAREIKGTADNTHEAVQRVGTDLKAILDDHETRFRKIEPEHAVLWRSHEERRRGPGDRRNSQDD